MAHTPYLLDHLGTAIHPSVYGLERYHTFPGPPLLQI